MASSDRQQWSLQTKGDGDSLIREGGLIHNPQRCHTIDLRVRESGGTDLKKKEIEQETNL